MNVCLSMHMYVHLDMCMCIGVYTHALRYVCTCMYVRMSVCMFLSIAMCIHVYDMIVSLYVCV